MPEFLEINPDFKSVLLSILGVMEPERKHINDADEEVWEYYLEGPRDIEVHIVWENPEALKGRVVLARNWG